MDPLVVLVTDRIYVKTRRHLEKIRDCAGEQSSISLACVSGFPDGIDIESVRDLVSEVIDGCVQSLADQIRERISSSEGRPVSVLALNQSSILPAIAIRRLLGLPSRQGFIESCDKRQMRRLLSECGTDLAMDYCEATPGETGSATKHFVADRYVVKPAFGMSSSDVKIRQTWIDAKRYAESLENAREWVPPHVTRALHSQIGRTDTRIIEPYIDGTEFSVDGWINDQVFHAIVQHKLCMVERTFIGDGPTVSPPIRSACQPNGWFGLENCEESICKFGRAVLDAIGFSHGVFHIEGRERHVDAKLCLIEVNPRAPGGSLWKSALLRTGYDLELVDAMIQLGRSVPKPEALTRKHVLHYPFYANNPGVLTDWGDLTSPEASVVQGLTVDFAARLGHSFHEADMLEEPYLAFAVAHDDTVEGLIAKCQAILRLKPPLIQPFT
jgi:ATP-grasp domain